MKKLLTEWRKYLKESTQSQFPDKLYHAIPLDAIPTLPIKGIENLPTDDEIQADRMGVPTCSAAYDAREFGPVIVEMCGNHLKEFGYIASENSKGHRVTMRDSSSLSSSGADEPMVDRLGTRVPYEAVTALVFAQSPDLKSLHKMGLNDVKIYKMTSEGELEEVYDPSGDSGG